MSNQTPQHKITFYLIICGGLTQLTAYNVKFVENGSKTQRKLDIK